MTVTAETACKLDLKRLMRAHKVTIRELSRRTGLTMKRVREVRKLDRVSYPMYCDWVEAVTGRCVWNKARYHAIRKQS